MKWLLLVACMALSGAMLAVFMWSAPPNPVDPAPKAPAEYTIYEDPEGRRLRVFKFEDDGRTCYSTGAAIWCEEKR